MTPLERAAVALANYDARQVEAPEIGDIDEFRFDPDRADYLARARSVLTGLREPSEAMLDNAVSQFTVYETWQEADIVVGPERLWQAMIDAALSEGA